jgi:hypothetical protein
MISRARIQFHRNNHSCGALSEADHIKNIKFLYHGSQFEFFFCF